MMTRGGVGRRAKPSAKPQGFADLSFVLSSVLDSQIHIHLQLACQTGSAYKR